MLGKIFRSYRDLPRVIHLLILLELSLNLIHVAFILILNIFLRKQGFSDPEIASFNSLRFIGALAFALPLGIYIRGKKLKPFFIMAALINIPENIVARDQVAALSDSASVLFSAVVLRIINGSEHTRMSIMPKPQDRKASWINGTTWC